MKISPKKQYELQVIVDQLKTSYEELANFCQDPEVLKNGLELSCKVKTSPSLKDPSKTVFSLKMEGAFPNKLLLKK
jgi:hypothetical protein